MWERGVTTSVSAFTDDLDRAVNDSHAALDAIVKGDPEPFKDIYSPQR